MKTPSLSPLAEFTLGLAMIAALLLLIAGLRLASRQADRQRGLLMIAAAVVILANVLVWTV